jgi:glucans biosynthesis protein C
VKTPDRLHSLDATRALALLLGIVLHAATSFVPEARAIGWPFPDVSPSRTLDVALFVIHIFRMTLFYVVAGYFARLAFHRKGFGGFVADRAKRIGVPFVVGWVLLLPLLFAILGWASTKPGTQGYGIPAEAPGSGVPLIHLWFLYLLLWLYALSLTLRTLFVTLLDRDGAWRTVIDVRFQSLVSTLAAPVVFAVPLSVSLYLADWWFMKTGIPTPERGLVPNVPAMVGYGVAFQVGWVMQRQVKLLDILRDQSWKYLAMAVVLTTTAWIMAEPLQRYAVAETSTWFRATYAACYAVAGWCWVFGVVGWAVRHCSHASASIRYVADASYWMYLAHLPLVFALQVLVMNWSLHWIIKFTLIVSVTISVLLLSYRFLVRSTFIGAGLNGYRRSPFPSKRIEIE